MPDPVFLDALVKLASLGTSGICIFAIFWTGWLLYKTNPRHPSPQWVKLVRYFIRATVVIAFISAASGALNAYFNAMTIVRLQDKNSGLSKELATASSNLTETSAELAKQKGRSDQLQSEKEALSGKLATVSVQLSKENLRANELEKKLEDQRQLLAAAAKGVESLEKSTVVLTALKNPASPETAKSLKAAFDAIRDAAAAKGHHP